jgi:hypothetical protein
MQVIEDNTKYWEVISSALAVGWLDVVVSSFFFKNKNIYFLFNSMVLPLFQLILFVLHFTVIMD